MNQPQRYFVVSTCGGDLLASWAGGRLAEGTDNYRCNWSSGALNFGPNPNNGLRLITSRSCKSITQGIYERIWKTWLKMRSFVNLSKGDKSDVQKIQWHIFVFCFFLLFLTEFMSTFIYLSLFLIFLLYILFKFNTYDFLFSLLLPTGYHQQLESPKKHHKRWGKCHKVKSK